MYMGTDTDSQETEVPAVNSSENIVIDPGVLHEETKAQSALTDIYGVPLFTKAYEQNILRIRNEKALEEEADWTNIFRKSLEGNVYEDTITSALFKGTQGRIIRGDPVIREQSLSWAYALVVFAVVLTAVLAGTWYRKQERRRKRNADIRHVYGS